MDHKVEGSSGEVNSAYYSMVSSSSSSLREFSQVISELEGRTIFPPGPPKLSIMRQALERLGFFRYPWVSRLTKEPERVILVAGTNGKGSTAYILSNLLSQAGERVGLYTSPHLQCTTERIRIDGQPLSKELFCRAYHVVMSCVGGMDLTHFEMLTLMAVWVFCSGDGVPPMDRIIMEVGLGGTWDATNAVPHGFIIITSLGLDHTGLLGDNLAAIASNKLGVIPGIGLSGRPTVVVHAPFPHEALEVVEEAKRSRLARWVETESFEMIVKRGKDGEPRFFLSTPWGKGECGLAGRRGGENAVLALTAFRELGYNPGEYLGVLRDIRWPGRMEKTCWQGRKIYLSGDHNPQGIKSLLELLPYYYELSPLRALVGIGIDKDLDGMLKPLFSLEGAKIFLTRTPFRGVSLDAYGPWLRRAVKAVPDPHQAFVEAVEATPENQALLVTGSLYLVGMIRELITREMVSG